MRHKHVAVVDSGFGREGHKVWEGPCPLQLGGSGGRGGGGGERCKLVDRMRLCPIRLCKCGVLALKSHSKLQWILFISRGGS